jgi:peptide/nickel transport system ATP-binding protein
VSAGLPPPRCLLEVRGLRVRLSTGPTAVDVLAGASLRIERGEICALVGRSGSGKSTLALALLGLLPAGGRIVSGSISIEGRRVDRLPERRRRRARGRLLALIPQDPFAALNPLARVGAQLCETLRWVAGLPRAAAGARARELLAQVGLGADPEAVLAAYPHQLSGGMAQRVAIALALAPGPKLLVADEPTAALDPARGRAVVELLAARARDEGTAVLLITHDLAAAAPVAQRVAVLAGGRIVEDTPTEEILARPRHEDARQLVTASFPAARTGRDRPPPRGRRQHDGENTALLRLDGICVHARERGGVLGFLRPRWRPILSCVDLIVREGEAVAVTGPSGGGKSTLAAVIAGLLQPSSGRVLFAGRDLLADRRISGPTAGREIQLVFQDHAGSLDPSWRVGAIVAEPLLAHGLVDGRRAARAAAAALLERVGLDATLAESLPGELSGGQKQRVALARALAARPRLLVLDEVTSALDVATRAEILTLLEEVRDTAGVSLLVVTHDPVVARRLADRILLMAEGRLRPADEASSLHAERTPRAHAPWSREPLAVGSPA